jgi:hypothetical protein
VFFQKLSGINIRLPIFIICGGINIMSTQLTAEDLEHIRRMYEASEKIGFNWVKAIRSFPAATKKEALWKEKMLAGIQLLNGIRSIHIQP